MAWPGGVIVAATIAVTLGGPVIGGHPPGSPAGSGSIRQRRDYLPAAVW